MSSPSPSILNIAAYKFAELGDLHRLREELREVGRKQELKGTILLSPEGINLFVAGSRAGVDVLLGKVRGVLGLADIEVKESWSREQPFTRMLVRIKREIIAFGVEAIDPRRYTSARVSARELKQWLDEGRPVTLLDTRNDYEVRVGTFKGAVPIKVDDFRDFPKAVAQLPEEMKRQPVVTFCTGGIRCEKAAPYLERAGFENVFQLDGGILKYLEECGAAHYDGKCFVFDQRVAVDAELKEGDLGLCFACQEVLTPEDRRSEKYVPGKSCPTCFKTDEQRRAELLASRQAAIARATNPLPGSVPYENERPLSVPARLDGLEVLDFLDGLKLHVSREEWAQACREGRLVCRGEVVRPGRIVRSGERLYHVTPAAAEPEVAAGIEILHEDEALVVVRKPAPLPMHPCGRFNRNSLSYILDQVYHPTKLRPAHRLDADTSGVVVFTKTREAARKVQGQFETGDVRKVYLARVYGRPAEAEFECHLRLQVEPGPTGVRVPDEKGVEASTHFRLLKMVDDGTSLLEVRPLTGRTNQIRAHLWALAMPIVGDPYYLREGKVQGGRGLSITDPPLCLHAGTIEFTHPLTGARVEYAGPVPQWAL